MRRDGRGDARQPDLDREEDERERAGVLATVDGEVDDLGDDAPTLSQIGRDRVHSATAGVNGRSGPHTLVHPPSMHSTWPVMKLLASLARNNNAPSSSCSSPPRPIGVR